MEALVVDQISKDEELVLGAMDSIIARGHVVSYQLLKRSVAEQLSENYDSVVHRLIGKRLLEEAYAEGFDLGLRRIVS